MRRNAEDGDAAGAASAPEELSRLLDVVMRLPRVWVAAMIAVAVASSVDVNRPAHGGTAVHVAVGTVAMIAVALIWLPALIRLLSLTGGQLKAAGVEASAAGLLGSSEALVQGLARIRSEAERVEQEAPEASDIAKGVQLEVDRIASGHLASWVMSDEALAQLARAYEAIRTQPPGDQRTQAMTQIVNEARLRARVAPEAAPSRGLKLVRSAAPGDRIVGLALLEAAPVRTALDDVLRLVRESASAFEMYHALLALERMAPLLSPARRRVAVRTLDAERRDPRGVGVMQDLYLPGLLNRVAEALDRDATLVAEPHPHG